MNNSSKPMYLDYNATNPIDLGLGGVGLGAAAIARLVRKINHNSGWAW